MDNFNNSILHNELYRTEKRELEFSEENAYDSWREQVREKLLELIKLPALEYKAKYEIEWTNEDNPNYREIRFILNTEPGYSTPCHILIPNNTKGKVPVVICLQGHSAGMHLSINKFKNDNERKDAPERDWDTAIRSVKQGYAAVILEQRAFGECENDHVDGLRCRESAFQALLLDRTMIGERCWDVMKLIDILDDFEEIDTGKIACLGNSGGGTISYFTACLDERISITIPSCYICNLKDSIFDLYHCECNYIPGFLKYFELADISCLIAPRKIVVVAGKNDEIFPLSGVKEAYSTIERIYSKAGVPENCSFVLGDGGHRFFADLSFPVINDMWMTEKQ